MFFLVCFFFQAEDGIRYLVRSRGLGDVYKRQAPYSAASDNSAIAIVWVNGNLLDVGGVAAGTAGAVCYTHLTLPTRDIV